MKLTLWLGNLGAAVTHAAYSGDIVQYWVDQTAILINAIIIGELQSLPSAWTLAIVQGAQYLAVVEAQGHVLPFQQFAVFHPAHNALRWIFHGTRNYASVDASLKAILSSIGLNPTSVYENVAKVIGQRAAGSILWARADDGNNNFINYIFGPVS